MTAFMSNDFDQPRWQQAALKNAYALLGKQKYAKTVVVDGCAAPCLQRCNPSAGRPSISGASGSPSRFEYAAAFFLLGGRLKDAVNVCVKHLNDLQLAVTIARLGEGERGPVLLHLLRKVSSGWFIPSLLLVFDAFATVPLTNEPRTKFRLSPGMESF